jgi:molybdenum cofactor cytidylyltransferase
MPKTVAILLAAGLSSRMGARNKLLLPVHGRPMIRHMVDTYHTATGQDVCVITGHEADEVAHALKDAPAKLYFNPDYEQGQPTSVACGLQSAPTCDRLLIGLSDQPLLTDADLSSLLDAHDEGDASKISIPLHCDQRGNPIVVPASLRARLLEDPRSPGCKKFTRAFPEHVQFHTLSQHGFYADIDTPDAYASFSFEATQ